MTRITLKQLHYFVAVADQKNIAAAARSLYISQPAITHALKLLEENLRVQLLLRHHARGVTLTSAGQELLVQARELLKHAQELELNIIDSGQELRGRLEIGCFFTLAPMYMPPLITQFMRMHPEVDLRLHEAGQEQLTEGLSSGRFDVAIMYGHALGQDLKQRPLLSPAPYILLSPEHPLTSKTKIKLSELVNHPMVLLDVAPSRDYFTGLFRSKGMEPMVKYWSPSFETVRGLVANNMGYSILVTHPNADVDYNGNPLCLRPIAEDVEPGYISLVRLKQRRPTRLMQAFREFSVKHFEKLSNAQKLH